jgi:hypothetical protein
MGSEVEKWKQQERGEISITNKSEFLSKNFNLRFTEKKAQNLQKFLQQCRITSLTTAS